MGVRSANSPATGPSSSDRISVITEAFSAFNEQNIWAFDGLVLEGPSENTVVPNRHCCTAKEPRDQSLDTLFLMGYPVRKQGSQKLFRRAAPTGFICLLQKMPPGHHLQKWQPQDPGSKLERDRFLFLCLSDLAVWQLFHIIVSLKLCRGLHRFSQFADGKDSKKA